MKKFRLQLLIVNCLLLFFSSSFGQKIEINQYGIFELKLTGKYTGNAFTDVILSAKFQHKNRVIMRDGFYDGDGVFKIRFMPDSTGEWSYRTQSNIQDLNGKEGRFTCITGEKKAHGPVHVHNTFDFAYADGTPYYPVGCARW